MTLKKLLLVAAVAVGALLLTGCIANTQVKSQDGKAYVVSGHIFGTNMYYCDASDGNPECWPVTEEERE